MNFALDRGWVDSNPVLVKLAGSRKANTRSCYRAERTSISRSGARRAWSGELGAGRDGDRRRLDELVTAKRDQIDHARQQLVIVGKGAKRRVVDLRVMNAYALIAALPGLTSEPVSVLARQGRALSQRVEQFRQQRDDATAEWAKANGVEFRRFKFHALRHWHAVEFLKAGWGSIYDLKQRLGHASLTTTEIYLSGEFLTEEEINQASMARARADPGGR